MVRSRRPVRDARKRVLRDAEDILTSKGSDHSMDSLIRIGVVWSGVLDLEDPLPPTTVAAMLAARDLVYATSTVDSEEHWIGAAAHAALGAYSEASFDDAEDSDGVKGVEGDSTSSDGSLTIGFTSPNR